MDNKHNEPTGYTYAQAGVDIAAGNALVRAIAPLANNRELDMRSTRGGPFGQHTISIH